MSGLAQVLVKIVSGRVEVHILIVRIFKNLNKVLGG